MKLPTNDFFKQSLNARHTQFQCEFEMLQRWLDSSLRNKTTRESIKYHILRLVDHILWIAQQYRMHPAGWSDQMQELPTCQKIWLDAAFIQQRESENSWREEIAKQMAHWITDSWEKYTRKDQFGDDEIREIKKIVLTQEENF